MNFNNKQDFINYWAKQIKKNDIVKYNACDNGTVFFAYVIQNNFRSLWVSAIPNSKPPFVTTIK